MRSRAERAIVVGHEHDAPDAGDVDIERSAATVSGQIAVGELTPVEFFGWIELIDRLERAAGAPAAGTGPGARDVLARAISEGTTHVV